MKAAHALAFALIIVGGIDVVGSNMALATGNIEANPLVGTVQDMFGSWWAAPKMVAHVLFAWFIIWLPPQRMIGSGVVMFFIAIVANNFYLTT